jgi:hypothetical protein
MKKIMIFAVLMLSVNLANAGCFGSALTNVNKPKPSVTLPPPAPEHQQENTNPNQFQQAVNNGQEGGSGGREGGGVSEVPVPAALPLMASALCMFGIARRRNNKS